MKITTFKENLIDQTHLFEAYARVQRHADRRNGAHRRQRDLTNCPVPTRSYKIPRALLPSFTKFIVEMTNSQWIEDSTREFCSTVLIIPEGLPHENKGYRFVVDLQQLNARTNSLQYMVPELGEMWAKLRNAKFISKLDLRHGFFMANGSASWKSSQNELFMRIWNVSIPRFANGPHHSFSCFSALGARTPQET